MIEKNPVNSRDSAQKWDERRTQSKPLSDILKGVRFRSDAIPTITLSWHHLPLTKLIHQNFSVVMSYAFSTPVLSKWVDDHFMGEWKYLNKALFEMPVERANLALLELATQLRLLDNHHNLSDLKPYAAASGEINIL